MKAERAPDLVIDQGEEPGRFRLSGRLDLRGAVHLVEQLSRADGPLRLDLSGVESFTGSGVGGLYEVARRRGDEIRWEHPPAGLREYLESDPAAEWILAADPEETSERTPVRWRDQVVDAAATTMEFLSLAAEFLYWVCFAPFRGVPLRFGRICSEISRIGLDAVPIVSLVSVLIGVILCLNAAAQLSQYGAERFAADLVAVALVRELAPVITAVLVAGRSGSAIAAEIATMRVSEEIDALRVMGINPRAFLVVPMLVGLMVSLPCLVMLADLIGIAGGFVIALGLLHLPFAVYWEATVQAVELADLVLGWIKGVAFGVLIGLTAATLGLRVQGGAAGVGRVTTRAVVTSFFLVILFNAVFTAIFYALRS